MQQHKVQKHQEDFFALVEPRKWFCVRDANSGGRRKLDHVQYYVLAIDEWEAADLFEQVTGKNPYNVSCSCCGADFDIYEVDEPRGSSPRITGS